MNTCSVFHYDFLVLLRTKQNNKSNLKISNLNFANFIFKSQKKKKLRLAKPYYEK